MITLQQKRLEITTKFAKNMAQDPKFAHLFPTRSGPHKEKGQHTLNLNVSPGGMQLHQYLTLSKS